MGGSAPSPPTVVMSPPPPPPTVYQNKNPKEAYVALADYGKRLYDQTQAAIAESNTIGGTPEQIGQRQLDTEARSAAAYASSLPQAASPSLKQVSADLLQKAKDRAAAGPPASAGTPAYIPPSWVYGQTSQEIKDSQKTA